MTAPKESSRPPVGRLPRALGQLLPPAAALIAYGGFCTFDAPAAYGYQSGQDVVVTTAPGAECLTQYRGGGGTTCDATWVVDGETVNGTLTSQHGGSISFLAGETTARVSGDTAYAGFDESELQQGLRGPYLLGAGLLLLLPGLFLPRSMARRAVDRKIDAGEQVPWGPFVLQRDGLGIGGAVVPWSAVEDTRGRTLVGPEGGTAKVVSMRVAGHEVDVAEHRVTYLRSFIRVVRARVAAARG